MCESAEPLFNAIKNNDLDAFTFAIQNGANVNHTDENGMTPLMLASKLGLPIFVSRLIDRGANVHAVDKDGRSALHYAVMKL